MRRTDQANMKLTHTSPLHRGSKVLEEQDHKVKGDSSTGKAAVASISRAADQKEPLPSVARRLERKPTEDINESADAFIKRFRQQLLLQRLESIENYEKMLARGL
ncbi:uncharacterized protein LOC131157200 [Malania oleifera]|uniref:uncharacterized protein LOC131157200 n=1 Tax=Malania oleifera TaxID=397392 RepID=UPI0025ADEEFE|nr:uncharacterized protein LOC131157200 [Malania oleifera]